MLQMPSTRASLFFLGHIAVCNICCGRLLRVALLRSPHVPSPFRIPSPPLPFEIRVGAIVLKYVRTFARFLFALRAPSSRPYSHVLLLDGAVPLDGISPVPGDSLRWSARSSGI